MKETLKTLNELLMLDYDAVRAYTAAIDRIDVPLLQERLAAFRADHERHIEDLSALIRALGGKPKEHRDVLGPLLQGVTAVRSMLSNEQALKAMVANEELTNAQYGKAMQSGLGEQALSVVRRNYDDEQRHLAWIRYALAARMFEREEGARL